MPAIGVNKHPVQAGRNYFAITQSTEMRLMDNISHVSAMYYLTVASVYSVAHAVMTDALALMRSSSKYRHEVKRDARTAMRMYYEWERRVKLKIGNRYQWWLDQSDEVYELVRPDIDVLNKAIIKVMNDNHERDPDVKALLLVSGLMAEMAERALPNFLDEARKAIGVGIDKLFDQSASFSPIRKLWTSAIDSMLTIEGDNKEINLNSVPECQKAMRAIQRKIYSPDVYNRAGEYAMTLNMPEVEYSEEPDSSCAMSMLKQMGNHGEDEGNSETKESKTIDNNTNKMNKQHKYYEVKVVYKAFNTVSETYKKKEELLLVEGDTLTSVEASVTSFMEGTQYQDGSMHITSARVSSLSGVEDSDKDESYYKGKIAIPNDAKPGKDILSYTLLVRAESIEKATEILDKKRGHGEVIREVSLTRFTGVVEL